MRLNLRPLAKVIPWLISALIPLAGAAHAQSADLREPQTFADEAYHLGQLNAPVDKQSTAPFQYKRITALACSQDGATLAVAEDDATVSLRSSETGRLLGRVTGFHSNVSNLAFHPDGNRFLSASLDGLVAEWNVSTRQRERVFEPHADWVTAVALAPDAQIVVAGGYDKQLRIWDYKTAALIRSLDTLAAVRSIAFSSDGQLLAAGCVDGVRIWKTSDWSLPISLTEKYFPINVVAFSPSGKWFAAGCDNGNIHLWDTGHWGEGKVLIAHPYFVTGLKFSEHDKALISCAADGKVLVWNPSTQQLRQVFDQHRNAITGLVLLPRSRALITASVDRSIKIRLGSLPDILSLPLAERKGKLVGMSADGKLLAVLEGTSRIQMIEASSGNAKQVIDHDSPLVCLTFTQAGQLCVASSDKHVRVWDVSSQQILTQFPTGEAEVLCLDASADGKRVAVGGSDGIWRLFDISDSKQPRLVYRSLAQSLPITKIAFAPDGQWIATAASSQSDWRVPGEAKLWVAATGQETGVLGQHAAQLQGLCFDPNSRLLATFGEFYSVRIWEVETRRELPALDTRGNVAAAAFTADSRGLIIARSEGKVDCWSLEQRSAYRKLDGHSFAVDALWVSQDRRLAATRDIDNTVKLWSISYDATSK